MPGRERWDLRLRAHGPAYMTTGLVRSSRAWAPIVLGPATRPIVFSTQRLLSTVPLPFLVHFSASTDSQLSLLSTAFHVRISTSLPTTSLKEDMVFHALRILS